MNRLLVTTVNSTPHGQLLVETVDYLVKAQQGFARLQNAVSQMIYGDPADFPQMAAELGMVDAGQAAALASLLAAVAPKINDALINEFIARCDQG